MATRSPLLRIHDMLESIRGIEKALAGKTMRDYERSWLLRSAVERGIEVISEASRHLGRDLKAQHKDVRRKDIAGIGNILRHDYQRVDASINLEGGQRRSAAAQGGAARAQGVLEIVPTGVRARQNDGQAFWFAGRALSALRSHSVCDKYRTVRLPS